MSLEWNPQGYARLQRRYQRQYGLALIDRTLPYRPSPVGTLLDMGCGNGVLTNDFFGRLLPRPHRVIGVDRDTGMIAAARKRFGRRAAFTWHCRSLTDWIAQDRSLYDLIFSNAVLHWLDTLAALRSVLQWTALHLSRDGLFAFRYSLIGNAEAARDFLESQLRVFLRARTLTLHRPVVSFAQSRAIMHDSGLDITNAEEITGNPFDDDEQHFQWMIYSQPLGRYLSKDQYASFCAFLRAAWEKTPVRVAGHHGVFIGRRLARR
ncbi:MAG: class I SAM-dependent methyltransferase [Deltaproteobacteria bacterium]|nr:class I SAM-dependent methyltransferase [Deltaproteobacteria bacterium]